jgi:hypothetical protein
VARRLIWVLAAVVLGSELSAATEPFSTIATEPFPTIAKRGIAAPKLDEAIARLPMPPSEPTQFWSRIANDSGYT